MCDTDLVKQEGGLWPCFELQTPAHPVLLCWLHFSPYCFIIWHTNALFCLSANHRALPIRIKCHENRVSLFTHCCISSTHNSGWHIKGTDVCWKNECVFPAHVAHGTRDILSEYQQPQCWPQKVTCRGSALLFTTHNKEQYFLFMKQHVLTE